MPIHSAFADFDLSAGPDDPATGRPTILLNGEPVRSQGEGHRFLFGWGADWVIKADAEQCPSEVRMWHHISTNYPEDRPFFAPIEAWGVVRGHRMKWIWTAQKLLPILEALRYYYPAEWEAGLRKLAPVLNRHNVRDVELLPDPRGGVFPRNWSLVDGQPVVYDYAMNFRTRLVDEMALSKCPKPKIEVLDPEAARDFAQFRLASVPGQRDPMVVFPSELVFKKPGQGNWKNLGSQICRDHLLLTLNDMPLDCSKRSTTRFVFGWHRFIVKVGFGGQKEVSLWKRLQAEDRKFFNPVVAHGTLENDPWQQHWVAQRILPIKRADGTMSAADWQRAAEVLRPIAEKYHVGALDFQQQRSDDWTVVNGQPVILDYGC